MQVGICSGDYKPPRSVEALFAALQSAGAECAQVSLSSVTEAGFVPDGRIEVPAVISRKTIEELRRASQMYNVRIISLNGTFNMAHPSKEVRDEGIRRFEGLCAAASDLGVPFISLCSGTRCERDLWTGHPANNEQSAMDDLFGTTERILRHAERWGAVLGVETEANNIIDSAERARMYMDHFASPRLKMILDAANLFHAGDAHRQNVRRVLDHAFSLIGRDIVMAHAKDITEGDGIRFCPTGEGIIDYPYFVKLLNDAGYAGDMLIHGVFDEAKMAGKVEFLKGMIYVS